MGRVNLEKIAINSSIYFKQLYKTVVLAENIEYMRNINPMNVKDKPATINSVHIFIIESALSKLTII